MCRFQDIQLLPGGTSGTGNCVSRLRIVSNAPGMSIAYLAPIGNQPTQEACYELGSIERQLEAIQRKG